MDPRAFLILASRNISIPVNAFAERCVAIRTRFPPMHSSFAHPPSDSDMPRGGGGQAGGRGRERRKRYDGVSRVFHRDSLAKLLDIRC